MSGPNPIVATAIEIRGVEGEAPPWKGGGVEGEGEDGDGVEDHGREIPGAPARGASVWGCRGGL